MYGNSLPLFITNIISANLHVEYKYGQNLKLPRLLEIKTSTIHHIGQPKTQLSPLFDPGCVKDSQKTHLRSFTDNQESSSFRTAPVEYRKYS